MDGARQEVSTGDIKAGRDITIAPTQIIVQHGDDRQREWVEALMRGPVDALGLTAVLAEAGQFEASGDGAKAAERLLDVARALKGASYSAIGDAYVERAARALDLAGDRPRALELTLEVLRSRFERDDQHVDLTLTLLRQVAGNEHWLPEAMEAAFSWPDADSYALDAVVAAVNNAGGRDDEAWWAAVAAELSCLIEDYEVAIDVSASVCERLSLASGSRLALELDVLEAIEQRNGAEAAEARWTRLLQWADDLAARHPGDTALVWQRRSVTLAYREDADGERRAALKAIQAWSRISGHEDQAAEAFYGHRVARQLRGDRPFDDSEIASFAAELRGSADTLTARADRHELGGLHARLDSQSPEARWRLFHAYRLHRRVGNLRGQLAVGAEVAELYEHVGETVAAVGLRIYCGHSEHARRLSASLPSADVVAALRFSGPRWERAASYAALDANGLEIASTQVAALGPGLLDEAEREPATPWGDDPVQLARTAAMNLVFADEQQVRDRALSLARLLSHGGYLALRRRALEALRDVTLAGVSDESERIVDEYLDNQDPAVSAGTIAAIVASNPSLEARLRTAGRAGYKPALIAMAHGAMIGDDEKLLESCREAVSTAIETETQTVTDGIPWAGTFDFSRAGLLGRFCDEPLRAQLVEKLVRVATDPADMEINRASAANAIGWLGPKMPESTINPAFDALEPLAHGAYGPSMWDAEDEASLHPFSRLRLDLTPPDALRAAATKTIGVVAERDGSLHGRLEAIAHAALTTGRPAVIASGLELLARYPQLSLPIPLTLFFTSENLAVRLGALEAYMPRHGIPKGELLQAVLSDPHERMRLRLRSAARGERDLAILRALQDDPNARVRALARNDLSELQGVPPLV